MNISSQARRSIAHRCGISDDYLYQVLTGRKSARAELCISIEKESGGAVCCETLRPDVDWAYLRGTARKPARPKTRAQRPAVEA